MVKPSCLHYYVRPSRERSGPARRGVLRRRVPGLAFAVVLALSAGAFAGHVPDREYLNDRAVLDQIQADSFRYFWEAGCPVSGMAYESSRPMDVKPVAVGGTGFGLAALVVAVGRKWVSHQDAVARLLKIVTFLRDRTPRRELRGAFPHWLDGRTGKAMPFGDRDTGADIVETSLLMQGLLLARAYFNGPGIEAEIRAIITELWEDVEWDWFTNNEENGLYWHWDPERGFHHGLKILGYNECFITYVLAASSPTHPISRAAYDYWTSGDAYQAKIQNDYLIEACPPCGSPLFLAQYSFIGLDPRRLADGYVSRGYFVRSVNQTLANRGYCLYGAPEEHGYSEVFWGLTACETKNGYIANSPCNDNQTVAPTAAVSSLPFTPHYSMQVLRNLAGGLRRRVWGEFGPYDGINLRDNWVSGHYLAIDQLPMVGMVENYRTGLLWKLFMADPDIKAGLRRAGLAEPRHDDGFPEVVPAFRKGGAADVDAYDIRRHPDSGLFEIPYYVNQSGPVRFRLADVDGDVVLDHEAFAASGRNVLAFPQFTPPSDEIFLLTLETAAESHPLKLRFH